MVCIMVKDPSRPLRVVLVDDSALMRQRLSTLLGSLPSVAVAGTAGDVPGAIALVDALHPDLVVLDVELENGGKGIDVLEHVVQRYSDMQVIALSNYTWQAMRDAYLAAGAKAFFDKALEFEQARQWVAELSTSRHPPSHNP